MVGVRHPSFVRYCLFVLFSPKYYLPAESFSVALSELIFITYCWCMAGFSFPLLPACINPCNIGIGHVSLFRYYLLVLIFRLFLYDTLPLSFIFCLNWPLFLLAYRRIHLFALLLRAYISIYRVKRIVSSMTIF